MADLLVCLVLAVIIGASVCYIMKEKKRGTKCIGCPAAGQCPHKCGEGQHHCHTDNTL